MQYKCRADRTSPMFGLYAVVGLYSAFAEALNNTLELELSTPAFAEAWGTLVEEDTPSNSDSSWQAILFMVDSPLDQDYSDGRYLDGATLPYSGGPVNGSQGTVQARTVLGASAGSGVLLVALPRSITLGPYSTSEDVNAATVWNRQAVSSPTCLRAFFPCQY